MNQIGITQPPRFIDPDDSNLYIGIKRKMSDELFEQSWSFSSMCYVSDAGGHPLVSRIANLGLVPKRIAWLT